MNNADIAARGERAQQFYDEFVVPVLKECRAQYADRLTDIAVTELNPTKRSEKITTLATAIRIFDNIDTAIRCAIEDGKIAHASMLRVDEIDRMTGPRKRLFEFVGY